MYSMHFLPHKTQTETYIFVLTCVHETNRDLLIILNSSVSNPAWSVCCTRSRAVHAGQHAHALSGDRMGGAYTDRSHDSFWNTNPAEGGKEGASKSDACWELSLRPVLGGPGRVGYQEEESPSSKEEEELWTQPWWGGKGKNQQNCFLFQG